MNCVQIPALAGKTVEEAKAVIRADRAKVCFHGGLGPETQGIINQLSLHILVVANFFACLPLL